MYLAVLCENTAENGFEYEHGLSLYIEVCSKKILFDMGQSDLYIRNAKRLGIDLADVDFAILSHGHYDHGGGLRDFLAVNKKASVYLSVNAFGDYYNGREKYIGLDRQLADSNRLVFTEGEVKLCDGITLFGGEGIKKEHPLGAGGLSMRVGDEFLPDDFFHEQYLMVEEGKNKVLFSGCAHRGAADIAKRFLPDVFVGGFHLSKVPLGKELENMARLLDSFDTDFYTCHCTGEAQFEFMKKYMKRLSYISAGSSMYDLGEEK